MALLIGGSAFLAGEGRFNSNSTLLGADNWVVTNRNGTTVVVHVFAKDNEGASYVDLSKLTNKELGGASVGAADSSDVLVSADQPAQIARIDPSGRDAQGFLRRLSLGGNVDRARVLSNVHSGGAYVITQDSSGRWKVRLVDPSQPGAPPRGLQRQAARLSSRSSAGPYTYVLLDSGALWLYDQSRGKAYTIRRGVIEGAQRVASPGTAAELFAVNGTPVAAILDGKPRLRILDGSGAGDEVPFPAGIGSRLVVPEGDVDGTKVWIADESGSVFGIPVDGGGKIVRRSFAALPGAPGRKSAPSNALSPIHVNGNFIYLLDIANRVLWQIPIGGGAARAIQIPSGNGFTSLDVQTHNKTIWVNDPSSTSMLVVDEAGNDRVIEKVGATTQEIVPEELNQEVVQFDKPPQKPPTVVVIDQTPTTLPPVDQGAPKALDTDGDGVPDVSDLCVDYPGLPNLGGCPDADGDGLPDQNDQCPGAAGDAKLGGCPDTDGDETPDVRDLCPDVAGKFDGCPDSDGDNIPDNLDVCPREPGTVNGCPDADGDGIPNASDPDADGDGFPEAGGADKCPGENGKVNGCPDADGDGFPEGSGGTDNCPGESGTVGGCPDGDGDGFPEGSGGTDKCPGESGTVGGCPDGDGDGFPEGSGGTDNCPNDPGPVAGCPPTTPTTSALPTLPTVPTLPPVGPAAQAGAFGAATGNSQTLVVTVTGALGLTVGFAPIARRRRRRTKS